MKHFSFFLLGFFLLTFQVKAQAPNSLNYQGVARNSSGVVLPNQNISLRFTIHQGSAAGTIVYEETKAATTNQLGLFTVAIGSGVVVSGNFATISWGTNTYYLQVEMDPTGGTSYLNMGTNQFLSVPYALNSGTSTNGWGITGNSISATFGTNFIGTTNTAPLEFYTNNAYSGVIDATKANVYFGNAGNGETVGNMNNGSQNVAIGQAALGAAGSTSNANVAIGNFALWSNTGSNNISGNNGSVAIGGYTMKNSTGNPNTAVGYQANYSLTSGINNVSIGYLADWSQTTASKNVAVGDSAAYGNTASNSVAIGTSALRANSGANNVAVGKSALQNNSSATGNTAVGYQSLAYNTTAGENTALGYQSLYANQNGIDNTAVGYQALYNNNVGGTGQGWYNVAVGTTTMQNNTTGQWNAAVGTGALQFNTTGTQNSALGSPSLYNNQSGNYNTAVGVNALNTNVSGSQNIAVGCLADMSANNLTNAIAIGYQAIAPVSNSITLGNSSVHSLYLPGYATANAILYTSASSGLVAATNGGTNGQVLTMVSGVPTWSSAGGTGTVTSVTAGTGLTGGTITTSGTIALANGTSAGQLLVTGASPFTPSLQTVNQDASMSGNGTVTVQGIQTVPVSATTPTTGNILAYNGTQWQATTGGSAGNVLQYSAGGVPTWVSPTGYVSSVSASGPLSITNATTTPAILLSGPNGGVLYGTGSGAAFLGAGPAGEVLEGQGPGQPPTWISMAGLTGTGDQWGTQVAVTDSTNSAPGLSNNTITGNGTGSSPLRLSQQGATNGQVLTWTGTTWTPGGGSGWQLTGNTGTTPSTNYIGTTDAKDVVFKAHNTEVMRIANANDNVGIGTPTPNAGAILDISSSTQGVLIPRMTSNPASPAQSMMYYNTTSGCFMFYNGTAWQSIVCGCPNVATAGAITGSTNFCPGSTGNVYSISPVSNATGYQWTAPAGAAITVGQGSNSISLTEGTVASSISVTASNNCGTGPASTLAVTPVSTIITGQPSNVAVGCASPGNATFTVTASGSPNYQWQVSTNSGSAWTPLTNTAPYSGVTTGTLTITNPPSTMNGYEYECVVTGACAFTSNPATLSAGISSVPITITNTVASSTTAANLNVQLSINFSSYTSKGLNASLNNVLFSTGPGGSGASLYAWIESPAAPTLSTTEITTTPTSANTAAVVWINLGALTVTNGSPATIYMTFMPYTVMTGATGFTGMAPQLTTPYAQFDNGALAFPNFYDNFTGTTLNATKWLHPDQTIVLNNNITITQPGGSNSAGQLNWTGIYSNTALNALGTIAESYVKPLSNQGANIMVNNLSYQLQNGTTEFGTGGTCTVAPNGNGTYGPADASNNWCVFSAYLNNGSTGPVAPGLQVNYGTVSYGNYSSISSGTPVGLGSQGGATQTFQWFRDRVLPPTNTAPTVAIGTIGCF